MGPCVQAAFQGSARHVAVLFVVKPKHTPTELRIVKFLRPALPVTAETEASPRGFQFVEVDPAPLVTTHQLHGWLAVSGYDDPLPIARGRHKFGEAGLGLSQCKFHDVPPPSVVPSPWSGCFTVMTNTTLRRDHNMAVRISERPLRSRKFFLRRSHPSPSFPRKRESRGGGA